MKTREELITELAAEMSKQVNIKPCEKPCAKCGGFYGCPIGKGATYAIDAGYRKQSDTVREFVRRVKEVYDKSDRLYRDYDIIDLWTAIIYLAKEEYGAEVEK